MQQSRTWESNSLSASKIFDVLYRRFLTVLTLVPVYSQVNPVLPLLSWPHKNSYLNCLKLKMEVLRSAETSVTVLLVDNSSHPIWLECTSAPLWKELRSCTVIWSAVRGIETHFYSLRHTAHFIFWSSAVKQPTHWRIAGYSRVGIAKSYISLETFVLSVDSYDVTPWYDFGNGPQLLLWMYLRLSIYVCCAQCI
jgi:hypothetical protein